MSVHSLLSRSELVELIQQDKAFRDAFALEFVKNSIPSQLRALRKERDWTQEDLGRATNKPRNVITRLENPNSNVPTIATMHEIASGCGVALLVKVIPFSELLKHFEDSEIAATLDIADRRERVKLSEWVAGPGEKTIVARRSRPRHIRDRSQQTLFAGQSQGFIEPKDNVLWGLYEKLQETKQAAPKEHLRQMMQGKKVA